MNAPSIAWNTLLQSPQIEQTLRTAMCNAAVGLSEMVGHAIDLEIPHIERLSIQELTTSIGSPETETVAIYLLVEGDLAGQAVLLCRPTCALRLVDLLMEQPEGTTTALDAMGRSALAEVGNLTVSYFLNELASRADLSLHPSVPAVTVDMLTALLQQLVSPLAAANEEVLLIDAIFKKYEQRVFVYFWILPGNG